MHCCQKRHEFDLISDFVAITTLSCYNSPGNPMTNLSLCLLGPPCIDVDGMPIDVDTRKAIALLVYLSVTRQPYTRDGLASLLWPEYDQTYARATLRRTLSTLNKALAGDWLEVSRNTISALFRS